MTDFDKLAKQALPCICGLDFHSITCPAPYRPAIVALLKAADANARRDTWEKVALVIAVAQRDEAAKERRAGN